MDLLSYLALKVGEEGAEVAQAASKLVQHGENDWNPNERKSSYQHLQTEIFDVKNVYGIFECLHGYIRYRETSPNKDDTEQWLHSAFGEYLMQYPDARRKLVSLGFFIRLGISRGRIDPNFIEAEWYRYVATVFKDEINDVSDIMHAKQLATGAPHDQVESQRAATSRVDC